MSNSTEIARHIKNIAKGADKNLPIASGKTIAAIVKNITGQTCSIEYNSSKYDNVRLMVVEDEANTNITLFEPKINSKVLVACMDGTMNNLYIVKVQEISRIFFKQGDCEFEMDTQTQKFGIKNNSNSLKSILTAIVDEVLSLKLFTPAGPSGTALPTSVTTLNQVKTKINNLLK